MSKNGVGIGLDVGNARIGVARGDFEVRVATPLLMVPNDESVFTNISQLVRDNHVEIVVVGLPRDAEGGETDQSQVSRDFAAQLEDFVDVEITFQDESLTSVLAEKNLRARKNFSEKMLRDGTLDSEAAAIILQDFLDSHNDEEA